MSISTDVVIIGAGASGLMCAIEAARRKRRVIVLDHASRIAIKVRISGGGQCNFTNLNISSGNYLSENPDFCKSALARFTPGHCIAMLEGHGIEYDERDMGQLFCRRSASQMVHMFEEECRKAGVEISLNCRVKGIKARPDRSGFIVFTGADCLETGAVVVATGGLSYKRLGASDLGYTIARNFGLKVTPLKPALVPVLFGKEEQEIFRELSGVSLDPEVSCRGNHFRGGVLFTHLGLSGPAILQVSSYWEKGENIKINLLPDLDVYEFLSSRRHCKVLIKNLLTGILPRRFAHTWCDLYVRSVPLNQYVEKELRVISHRLQHWVIQPSATEGYDRAEVTLGGVDTDELSSKTMEAKKVPDLYFIGEVVDVTGQLGGYNLHWAWASGYAAGQYV